MKKVEICMLEDFEEIREFCKNKFICENGELLSFVNTRGNVIEIPKILKGTVNSDGYIVDDFYNKKTKKGFKIFRHQLVAIAFKGYKKGDYSSGIEIDHINRIRNDNREKNIRITNRKGNMNNSSRIKESLRKFDKEKILEIYKMKFIEKRSYSFIAEKFGVKYPTIILICNGKTYKEIYGKEIANFV